MNAVEVAALVNGLASAPFVAGRRTAGWAARDVKHVLKLDPSSTEHRHASTAVLERLFANEVLQSAALPKALSSLIFSRAEPGMHYGTHVDNAIMGSPPIRTDLAFTLFLSPPESYDGGNLVVTDHGGEQSVKLEAGAIVLYPATTLHRVETVLSGARTVCVGWIQSLVRDPRIRELLFDLNQVVRQLRECDADGAGIELALKSHANVLRMFADA